jgi:hypothetical protein
MVCLGVGRGGDRRWTLSDPPRSDIGAGNHLSWTDCYSQEGPVSEARSFAACRPYNQVPIRDTIPLTYLSRDSVSLDKSLIEYPTVPWMRYPLEYSRGTSVTNSVSMRLHTCLHRSVYSSVPYTLTLEVPLVVRLRNTNMMLMRCIVVLLVALECICLWMAFFCKNVIWSSLVSRMPLIFKLCAYGYILLNLCLEPCSFHLGSKTHFSSWMFSLHATLWRSLCFFLPQRHFMYHA